MTRPELPAERRCVRCQRLADEDTLLIRDGEFVHREPCVQSPGMLAAADLFEFGAVRPETRARMRELVGAELRRGMTPEAREAVAAAYRAQGNEVPAWLK